MSQADMEITAADANTGIAFRAATNAALQALASNNAGAGDPATTYPYQFKVDTGSTPKVFYMRKGDNTAWTRLGYIDSNGRLILDRVITYVVGPYTALLSDDIIIGEGTFTITLPQVSSLSGAAFSKEYTIINDGTGVITVDGNGTETIREQLAVALNPGEILIIVANGGTAWKTLNYYNQIRDQARGLIIKNNITNPNYQVDIDADEIILQNSSNQSYRAASVNLTVDITASGANGLDTGSEAASTWYHIWVIYNGTTVAGLLSTSATAPTMPSGYTYKAYVGAIYNSSGSNFVSMYQQGNRVRCQTGTIITFTETTATSKSLAAIAPTTAKNLLFIAQANGGAGVTSVICIHPITFSASANVFFYAYNSDTSFNIVTSQGECPIETAQTIYVLVNAGTGYIYPQGWEY